MYKLSKTTIGKFFFIFILFEMIKEALLGRILADA